MRVIVGIAAIFLSFPISADDMLPVMRKIAGIVIPADFVRNETLSVAGQQVYEFITAEGDRDLLAVTPAVRQRSIDILVRGGFRDYCRPSGGIERILFHRRPDGMTWFVVADERTAHIVLDDGSRHIEHFLAEINGLCTISG